jgi:hypothetical protein
MDFSDILATIHILALLVTAFAAYKVWRLS